MDANTAISDYAHMSEPSERDRIINAMMEQGMSMAQLAERSGVSYDVINKLKRRPESSTSADNALKLKKALGILEDRDTEKINLTLNQVLTIARGLALEIAKQSDEFPFDPEDYAAAFTDLLDYRLKNEDIAEAPDPKVVDFRFHQLARKSS